GSILQDWTFAVTELRPQSPVLDSDEPLNVPAIGTIIAGKYRVDGVVGAGGMGVVVAAEHITLGQSVAIKLLTLAGLDAARATESRARFVREGRAAARLTSDHVVRVHDVGTLDDGAPFMVMELLRGDDLGNVIAKHGPCPPDLAVEYVVQACDAVGEAHGHGIVHRDLKPSNLFVTKRSDGHPVVKVLDFGISKAMAQGSDPFEGSLTATRTVVGSPYYMSPEQVRDAKRVDARSDIWSLGMILYELLVGEPAFNADTLPGICAAIAADAPQPVRERRADVSPDLEAIVMRCLEKDAGKRFQTVAELVRALAPFLPANSGVSTAVYTTRRLEEAAVKQPRSRAALDEPTIQSAPPDSGMRLSNSQTDAPFGISSSAGSESGGSLPSGLVGETPASRFGAAATLASVAGKGPAVVVREATLVSRTGATVPAPNDQDEPDVLGVASRAPETERTAWPRRPLMAIALAVLLGALAYPWLRSTPPAVAPPPAPLLHEPVGPAPPSTEAEPPFPSAASVGELRAAPPEAAPPPSAAPSAVPSGRATVVGVVGRGTPKHGLKSAPPVIRVPKPTESPKTAAPPGDIRLER
ncbi:MAG TPA: serine/threonine-protein kinase, partial [Polyangiaceae bacterium]